MSGSHHKGGTTFRDPSTRTRRYRCEGRGGILHLGGLGLALLILAGPVVAQDDHHGPEHAHGGAAHHAGLHFTHPLIAESISPDTKLRIDHQMFDFTDGEHENSGALEGEYAFSRSFSIEAGIPYSYTATEFGNFEVLFKFANYAFERAGVLLGYGLEVVAPTNGTPDGEVSEHEHGAESSLPGRPQRASYPTPRGRLGGRAVVPAPRFSGGGGGVEATLGTQEWEVAPFLNAGLRRGPWELVAWALFAIPFNQAEPEEVGTELEYNVSVLYHVSARVQALLELDGSGGISGEAVGEDVANLSPGLRVRLLPDQPLVLGTSVGFPVSDEKAFDFRWATSLFWHF